LGEGRGFSRGCFSPFGVVALVAASAETTSAGIGATPSKEWASPQNDMRMMRSSRVNTTFVFSCLLLEMMTVRGILYAFNLLD
jgi:hypothetical protein